MGMLLTLEYGLDSFRAWLGSVLIKYGLACSEYGFIFFDEKRVRVPHPKQYSDNPLKNNPKIQARKRHINFEHINISERRLTPGQPAG